MRYVFAFKSFYRGELDYTVYDRESQTERRICVDDASGRARYMIDPIPAEVLDAFNAWRREKHQAELAHIERRYGPDALADCRPFREYIASEVTA